MIALALLLAMLAPDGGPDDGLADQIVRCGIAREQVEDRIEEGLGEVARITTPDAALTSDHLACLVGLALEGRVFAFTDPAAQARFDPLVLASERKAAEIEARGWLREHGLLDKLPVYDPARQSLADYGVALETLCDIAPGKGVRAEGTNLLVIAPSNLPDEGGLAAFQCIVSASLAADLEAHGVTVGLVDAAAAGQ